MSHQVTSSDEELFLHLLSGFSNRDVWDLEGGEWLGLLTCPFLALAWEGSWVQLSLSLLWV